MQYNDNSKLNTLSRPYANYENNVRLYHEEPVVFDFNTTLPIACFTELPKRLRKREITLDFDVWIRILGKKAIIK